MIDSDALMLDPIYDTLGAAAVLKIAKDQVLDVTVIDMTSGADVSLGGIELPVIKPAAMLRLSEFETLGGEVSRLKGATLTVGVKAWEIVNYKRKPVAGGKGEVMLILADGDI